MNAASTFSAFLLRRWTDRQKSPTLKGPQWSWISPARTKQSTRNSVQVSKLGGGTQQLQPRPVASPRMCKLEGEMEPGLHPRHSDRGGISATTPKACQQQFKAPEYHAPTLNFIAVICRDYLKGRITQEKKEEKQSRGGKLEV